MLGGPSGTFHLSVCFERCGNERAWKIRTEGVNWRCAVAPGSSPETQSWLFGLTGSGALTRLWHWPLCDEPVHGWQKKQLKLNKFRTQTCGWSTKLSMIHPHHFPERDYGLGHRYQPTQVQKWRAKSAQGCTGAAYMQFERYRNGVSLECMKWPQRVAWRRPMAWPLWLHATWHFYSCSTPLSLDWVDSVERAIGTRMYQGDPAESTRTSWIWR